MVDRNLPRGRAASTPVVGGLAIALFAATFAPAPVRAEEAADVAGEAILVTGKGLKDTPGTPAYSTQILARDALVSASSGRIEDGLSAIAGFQQFRRSDSRSSNPSAQGVTLRALGGNASSRALILLDGVPMADPFFGYIPFTALSPDALGSVRITRGGGSGPFGAGALSGTIALESADADQLGLVTASLLGDQRGESEASASFAPRLGGGFAVLTGRWDRGKGFWTTPADQRVDASVRAKYESWSVGLRTVAPLTPDIELQARALVFRDNRTLRFAGADSASEGQDASLRLVGRGAWAFDALAYVQMRNFSNVVVSSTRFVPVLDQYKTPATGIGGKLELRPPVGEAHTLRLGLDARRASGTMNETAISAMTSKVTERRKAGGDNTDLGFFLEDDWRLGALTLTGGVRADRSIIANGTYATRSADGTLTGRTDYARQADWGLTARGGALVALSDAVKLRAAAYSGLRQPTLNELYRPFTVFPVTTLANAELRNERLVGYEAGLDLTPLEGVRFSLTGFDNRVRHAIANVTIGTNLRQRQNLPAIDAQGVELGAHVARGVLRFDGSLLWNEARVDGRGASADLDRMRPAQTPRFVASGTLGVVPAQGWKLSATLRHVGAQYEDDQETDILPAATTLDLFAEFPLAARAKIVLRAENLFDETIITRNQGGSMDLGAPRTLWAGLRWGM
ncbi:TonB-dependent receptor [Novosphingobium sp. 1949]|uniref:TonB-dependent receptor n=1 Tax=Novosphingobium organovorum TaxID=2930092 RepID=A0ABT0BC71_9SPHN|nr:TonB-dependent receptor [Novosphingobium organovorum]MCJ2182651.1 TonB-dependent receptor [Novosphingobium organovorum]